MEPVTHALTSLALARAGQRHLPRFGTAIMLTAGLAPDLDYASYLGGAGAFLRWHRAALHSVVGGSAVALVTALAFCTIEAKSKARATKSFHRRDAEDAEGASSSRPLSQNTGLQPRLRFLPALAAGAVAVAGHVALDLASGTGVQLMWPFQSHRYAWDLAANLDPWILIVLAVGLAIPPLLRMVSEEIGERERKPRGGILTVVALAIVAAYLGARGFLHDRALDLLTGRDYHGRAPLSAGAFPASASPFEWRGIVITDNTVEEISVPVGSDRQFDPDRSTTQYKPEGSAALEAGQRAEATQIYLRYARLPFARLARREDGYRFELRDLQFAAGDLGPENIFVRVDMDGALHVVDEKFLFAASPNE